VGLTLLAIGAMGLYETFFDAHDEEGHPESDPTAEALTGGWMRGVRCVCVCVGWGAARMGGWAASEVGGPSWGGLERAG
jgi:hypothetical protein